MTPDVRGKVLVMWWERGQTVSRLKVEQRKNKTKKTAVPTWLIRDEGFIRERYIHVTVISSFSVSLVLLLLF